MSDSFPQLARLLDVLRTLRGPGGSPWDQEQDLASAARHLTDEVHEYAEVAHAGPNSQSQEELGDLLYLVAFHWLLHNETSSVSFDQLAGAGADKLIRRLPHVFGDEKVGSVEEANELWNAIKAREKSTKPSSLKDLAASASALRQALRYGEDGAAVGFDWPDPEAILHKVHEELDELAEAREQQDGDAIEDELGDVLFAVTQLGRKLGVDPDRALRRTNAKFARRFRSIEDQYENDPARIRASGVDQLMKDWEAVKRDERKG